LRDASGWLDYLADALSGISRLFDSTRLVFVESDSRDATIRKAARLVDLHGGSLLKLGPDPIRAGLHRTARLSQFRRRARAACLETSTDWILFIDTDIYFGLQTIQALFHGADRQGGRGLFTAYTLGIRVLARSSSLLLVKSRGVRERHYFDTFALDLENEASTFPKCPFKGCTKCRCDRIDPRDCIDLRVRAAFGGLGLIRSELLRETGADWGSPPEGECEHLDFCRSLAAASVPTFVVTDAVAYCDR